MRTCIYFGSAWIISTVFFNPAFGFSWNSKSSCAFFVPSSQQSQLQLHLQLQRPIHTTTSLATASTNDNDHPETSPSPSPLFIDAKELTASPISNTNIDSNPVQSFFDRISHHLYHSDDSINGNENSQPSSSSSSSSSSQMEMNKKIVQYGQFFQQTQNANDFATSELISPPERVPGCIATVHVQTILTPISSSSSSSSSTSSSDS